MLVNSSQSSTQRPLGLSVEELFALDRQYRRIEQQQQHIAQLQSQTRVTSSNLNRLASRSLDLISSPPSPSPSPLNPLTVLPSLHVHGQGYTNRSQHPPLSVLNYPRSHSIDHQQYVIPNPPPPLLKHTYPQRPTTNDVGHQRYQPKYKPYVQQSTGKTLVSGSNFAYDLPQSSIDYSDNRSSCKLRRQHPIKRESSRRIVVRPVIHRRREPSISSSCESLDEPRTKNHYLPTESYTSHQSITFAPSPSLVEDAIDDLPEDTNNYNNDSLSDDSEINLYEMRVSIGKTYDTSDIGVQLEGAKVLIHCHTIEPTDKRGNYRKHELKTELFVPDIVDDSTIVAYLTEDGELIVEGKYHLWAWKEIKKKRQIEKEQLNISPSSKSTTIKNNRRGKKL
jgi:hypothetical protein